MGTRVPLGERWNRRALALPISWGFWEEGDSMVLDLLVALWGLWH